jgi:hypothetical protein
VQLASPTEASLGASATSLTNSEDPAATVGITDRITLSAVLKFDDGSTKSMTSDARTVFTVTAGSDLVILVGNKLYAVAGTSGSATVTLSFANYSGAAALTASRTVRGGISLNIRGFEVHWMTRRALCACPYVTVIKASGVRIESRPSPSYSGSGTKDMVLLRPIACSGVYQRAALVVGPCMNCSPCHPKHVAELIGILVR